jgi:CRP/FNR family transcriptional regulator, anaerobic regulatory protein
VTNDDILVTFDFYAAAPEHDRRTLRDAVVGAQLAEHAVFYREGEHCRDVGLVVRGDIRVFTTTPSGREVTLYHVRDRHPCLVNMLSVFLHRGAMASAVVEAPTEALLIRADVFRNLLTSSAALQRFVFETMAERMVDVMTLVEEVVVRRMDARLAAWLLRRFEESAEPVIAMTHEEIAAELGTAREVVSRLLKDFERKGSVHLSRARILLVDRRLLAAPAAGHEDA